MKSKVLTEVVSTHNWDTKPKLWADWMLITCFATIFDLFITCLLLLSILTNSSPFFPLPFSPSNSSSLIFFKLASLRRRRSSNSLSPLSSNSNWSYPSLSEPDLGDGVAFTLQSESCNLPLLLVIGKRVPEIWELLRVELMIEKERGLQLQERGTQLHMLIAQALSFVLSSELCGFQIMGQTHFDAATIVLIVET